jgi:uncharacterized membrane protein
MRKKHKGQAISLADAPTVVMIVGFVFLIMATVAYVADEYGDAIGNSSDIAYNVTQDLQEELDDNTSIAGVVLTISLIGIVLSILIGIFLASRRGL